MTDSREKNTDGKLVAPGDIAIVGMAVHLPGARTWRDFWRNLEQGVDSSRRLSDEELLAAGVPRSALSNPRYVKSAIVLEGLDLFDPEFFGLIPKEAAIMDPQHRRFLQCAWEALEDAGHVPEQFAGSIGVFAGCGMNAYFTFNLLSNAELVDSVGLFLLRHTGNDKDFLPTRVSYCFNLTGPSIAIQTACSTSLVAVHQACQSLISGECDLALAGGVTIELPHGQGYWYQEGEILSPDGHCRAFDHRSQGTVFGSGAGVVVLRRLADALEAGDHIYAVVKGTAINNDGAGKVGYLAPSVGGQAAAIAEALAVADVSADAIGYVECHGTGTPVGDPIEIAALTEAFRRQTERSRYCGIGSVKTNIGHLDTAAGVASLIKAAMALDRGQMPPSLNYEAPNPQIDFVASPFFVNDRLRESPRGSAPRRARIKQTYDVHYPISVLFEAPTVEACAALVKSSIGETAGASASMGSETRTTHRPRFRHLVAMHEGDPRSRAPLFIAAGMFGNVLNLRHLAHLIGGERACYGLQARGLYGDHPPHETFEEAAADYLREVRAVQPVGPFFLAGFSGGGITAYEMALQLVAEGEHVGLLAMLDTPLPYSPRLSLRDKLTVHVQKLRRDKWRYFRDRVRARIRWELERRRRRNEIHTGSDTAEFQSRLMEEAFYRALGRYRLRPYPGRLALFRPKLNPEHVLGPGRMIDRDRRFLFEDNGWSPHVRAVDVHEVPSNHDSMVLEPNVRVLGANLRRVIAAAEAEHVARPDPLVAPLGQRRTEMVT